MRLTLHDITMPRGSDEATRLFLNSIYFSASTSSERGIVLYERLWWPVGQTRLPTRTLTSAYTYPFIMPEQWETRVLPQ